MALKRAKTPWFGKDGWLLVQGADCRYSIKGKFLGVFKMPLSNNIFYRIKCDDGEIENVCSTLVCGFTQTKPKEVGNILKIVTSRISK